MSKVKNDSKPTPTDAVKKAVGEFPGATVAGIAPKAGIAALTARKLLADLADAGEVTRHVGGREGRKRLPDSFTLKGVKLSTGFVSNVTDSATVSTAARPANGKGATKAKPTAKSGKRAATSSSASAEGKPERLKAGDLEPLVLKFLEQHKDDGPHGPTQVAKALGRSSGAVSNCLVRLTGAKHTKQVTKKPRRYTLAA